MAKLLYNVDDKPPFKELLIFALQQLLAIIAGTIAVPKIVGIPEMIPAAILGCGIGTMIYIFVTKRKSPVILSSNFAFIGALSIAAKNYGYLGICLGGILTGLVYVILAIVVKKVGTSWIDKLLPPIIIGPVVALIGLTLAANAITDLTTADGYLYQVGSTIVRPFNLIALLCGLITFFVVLICGIQNKRRILTLTPFLIGIVAGYLSAIAFSIFGYIFDQSYLKIIDFSPIVNNFSEIKLTSFIDLPRFALLRGIGEISTNDVKLNGIGVLEIALAFMPVALVSFSEHIADHKNLSSVIGKDLLNTDPGLHKTLLADGLGSIFGTCFGTCPETTYSQSIGCVAITKNASVRTMILTSLMCIILSFLTPVICILQTIPSCVMGGICLALYGFIATSGLRMLNGIQISEGKNLYTLSVILVAGIGSLVLQIPYQFGLIENTDFVGAVKWIEISAIAMALILGVITYRVASIIEKHNKPEVEDE